MYSTFVVSGSVQDIGCSPSLQSDVYLRLEPPYEDLFDSVEEGALMQLYTPYRMFKEKEQQRLAGVSTLAVS